MPTGRAVSDGDTTITTTAGVPTETCLAVEGQIPTTRDLLTLEKRKAEMLQQLLSVKIHHLSIEERNLAINERNLKINEEELLLKRAEKNVQCLSPLISFHH